MVKFSGHKSLACCIDAFLLVVLLCGCMGADGPRLKGDAAPGHVPDPYVGEAAVLPYDPSRQDSAPEPLDDAGEDPGPDVAGGVFPEEGPVGYMGFEIPAWNGADAWYELNSGEPFFEESERSRIDAFETYSDLDALGRCGTAYANVCQEIMPVGERGEIGSVRPSGWHTVRYNDLVSGNYLYNRCHLIGYQLAGENANEKNLITGTRYLNIEGMLGFEDEIDDYVDSTGNHVLYRVTPVYDGDDLVARGVVMEAFSVEDDGDGVCFNIFAYNNQPGIVIDYATGNSKRLEGKQAEFGLPVEDAEPVLFVLNADSGKFHRPDCRHADSMSEDNRLELVQTLDAMLDAGYVPCGSCHPDEVG